MQVQKSIGPAGLLVAVLALVVAMSGGSAVAASLITTKQIKNNAVTTAKIKNNAVTGAKVKNGTLTLKDFKASERTKILRGSGIDTVTVESPEVRIPAYDIGSVIANCPAGKKATGGGYFASIAIPAASFPTTKTSWGVVINNSDNPIPVEVTAWVVCA